MAAQFDVLICDETSSGQKIHTQTLPFSTNRVSIQDIIDTRVRAEVDLYLSKKQENFRGLVQPKEVEITANGYKASPGLKIDADLQVEIALKAFEQNRYFMLVDDKQAESLDEVIELKDETKVSFIKLVQLIGG